MGGREEDRHPCRPKKPPSHDGHRAAGGGGVPIIQFSLSLSRPLPLVSVSQIHGRVNMVKMDVRELLSSHVVTRSALQLPHLALGGYPSVVGR